jgi:hypothetical protein
LRLSIEDPALVALARVRRPRPSRRHRHQPGRLRGSAPRAAARRPRSGLRDDVPHRGFRRRGLQDHGGARGDRGRRRL